MSQKKEVLDCFAPYRYKKSENFYTFSTDCSVNFSVTFSRDNDPLIQTANSISYEIGFQRDRQNQEVSNITKVIATIATLINDVIESDKKKKIILHYLCSFKSLRPTTEELRAEKIESNFKNSIKRHRLFRLWFQKCKNIFPKIKLSTFGAEKQIIDGQEIEGMHLGLIYHIEFPDIDELKGIVSDSLYNTINRDKNYFFEGFN